jgi:dTMP kinase
MSLAEEQKVAASAPVAPKTAAEPSAPAAVPAKPAGLDAAVEAARYGVLKPRLYPGRLFVVEGIDGSGKSTQLTLLAQWLRGLGYPVVFSEWNSSPIVKATTSRGKRRKLLTPLTFSLIHATDFLERVEREIVPSLKAGAIVLADRYVYTAFARDVVRGVDPEWVRALYRFAPVPTAAFYFRVPLETALHRILSGRPKLKWFEAGMDLGLNADPRESYRLFQGRILEAYEGLIREYGLHAMDATFPVEAQQRLLRQTVTGHLRGLRKTEAGHAQHAAL